MQVAPLRRPVDTDFVAPTQPSEQSNREQDRQRTRNRFSGLTKTVRARSRSEGSSLSSGERPSTDEITVLGRTMALMAVRPNSTRLSSKQKASGRRATKLFVVVERALGLTKWGLNANRRLKR